MIVFATFFNMLVPIDKLFVFLFDKGEDDFTPFRNIMNEWYAKDMSREIRSTLKTKNSQGYAIGQPPLGYKKDPDNPKLWVIDEEGAQIIEKIYNLRK